MDLWLKIHKRRFGLMKFFIFILKADPSYGNNSNGISKKLFASLSLYPLKILSIALMLWYLTKIIGSVSLIILIILLILLILILLINTKNIIEYY